MNKNTRGYIGKSWFDHHPIAAVIFLSATVSAILFGILYFDSKMGNAPNPFTTQPLAWPTHGK